LRHTDNVKTKIENLQKDIINSINFLNSSEEVEKELKLPTDLPRLPINWLPGGKRDKHNYYKSWSFALFKL